MRNDKYLCHLLLFDLQKLQLLRNTLCLKFETAPSEGVTVAFRLAGGELEHQFFLDDPTKVNLIITEF